MILLRIIILKGNLLVSLHIWLFTDRILKKEEKQESITVTYKTAQSGDFGLRFVMRWIC